MSSNKALVTANTCPKWTISMQYLTTGGSWFQGSVHVRYVPLLQSVIQSDCTLEALTCLILGVSACNLRILLKVC